MTGNFIKKIKIEDNEHLFFCKGNSIIVDSEKINEHFIFKKQKYSTLYRAGNRILKVCYAQSIPKDLLRKYVLGSQAEREFKSSAILSHLGLLTPESCFSAFSLSPLTKDRIESLHEMSFLEHFEDIDKHFVHRRDSSDIVRCFAKDLAIISNNMFFPKDLGLGNIMYNEAESKIAWLDTDLKKITGKTQLAQKLMAQLTPRFLRYLSSPDTDLFWDVFCEQSTLFPRKSEMTAACES